MPWKEASKMSELGALIRKWVTGLYTVTELAREFSISRPTVYQWTQRYDVEGEAGLIDRRSIPGECPHRTSEEVAHAIIKAKRDHPFWGPSKLIKFLKLEQPDMAWPAASTAGLILDREGLVQHRRPRRKPSVLTGQHLNAAESGQMMTVDHKGQFRMGNGEYIFPVTINDPVSRYIYAIAGKKSTSSREAKSAFIRVFEEHGVPVFIGSDNGSPFSCSHALGGLSVLAVWWITLGITPMRIHPGCPWENGVHERMHKTLKAETARPPAMNTREQQKRFDSFRMEFNAVRPHDGIGGRRPAELLKKCSTAYPRRSPEIEYPGHYEPRSVRRNGVIRWKGDHIFLSETLAGKRVGLVEIGDGIWSIYFNHFEVGRYDEQTKSIA